MAAPIENFDPFGNDALFEEFEKPAPAEDWDTDMAQDPIDRKVTVTIDKESGRKHLIFDDSSDSEDDPIPNSEEKSVTNGTPYPEITPASVSSNTRVTPVAQNSVPIDPSCCVQVTFLNKKFADRHKDEIETFIQGLISETGDEIQYSNGNSNQIVDCCNFYTDFLIDSKGNQVEQVPENYLEDQRPVYEQVFRKSLPCESESEDDEDACPQTKQNHMKSSCWNCGGSHSLNECKEPKDHNKIAINRAAFMAAKQFSNQSLTDSPKMGDSRYHADEDPKFASFKPGMVSDSLREALGIGDNELPPYIYNMRKFGYPPGHLLAAKLTSSDIVLFDKHGQEVAKDGQVMEDGEVDENAAKGGYNYDKIIEYYGFTVKPESNTQDYQDPPFNDFQLKSNLPNIFGPDVFRKTDGLERDSRNSVDLEEREEQDMDMGVDGSPVRPVNPDSTTDSEIGSLSDLEKARAEILRNLESETATETESEVTESEITESEAADTDTNNQLTTPSMARSKSVLLNMGTPIGVNSSQVLPDSDKFRQNITEHIPYENLPNATGMFNKMMKVIDKVKDALTSIRK